MKNTYKLHIHTMLNLKDPECVRYLHWQYKLHS